MATVCDVLADFTDIKARRTWHHSRVVAEVATRIGRNLGLHERELVSLERAGLVHDLGKAGVPCAILVKQTALSEPEAERLRLHARYSELVLEKVERLRGLAEIAGAHHEWFDGSGYHRRLAGEQIPLAARVLGLADAYSLAVQSADAAAEPEAVLDRFRPLVGKQFDPDCFEALLGTSPLQAESRTRTTTRSLVERLTTREIEVLRQVALGQSNRRVAETLVISEKTVEHHLDHIYGKLGVSCRTSAVVFAVHQGLI